MNDVIKNYVRADRRFVEEFSKIGESASIYEVMKQGAMTSDIRPIWPGVRMCGTALTVKTKAADNLMLHKAIDMSKPGDVIVVDCGEYIESGGMCGGLMAASMKMRGAVGIVTNGALRDSMAFKELGMPAYARALNVKESTKCQKGFINHPIIVGGVLINPGDIIFGDNDAVVVIPKELAEEALAKAKAREEEEAELERDILAGKYTIFELDYKEKYAALGLTEDEEEEL